MPKKRVVKKKDEKLECDCKNHHRSKYGGGLYFLGYIGSAIYFVSTATSFWSGAWGLIKSLVWPAFLVFESLKFFRA